MRVFGQANSVIRIFWQARNICHALGYVQEGLVIEREHAAFKRTLRIGFIAPHHAQHRFHADNILKNIMLFSSSKLQQYTG